MWSELTWSTWSDFISKWNEVKWFTVKFLGIRVACTLEWFYTEVTSWYCDYFIWVYLVRWLFNVYCSCFNLYYGWFNLFCNAWLFVCVGVLVIGLLVSTVFFIVCTLLFVLFRLCIFILICFVSTSVRTIATEWRIAISSSSNSSSSSSSNSRVVVVVAVVRVIIVIIIIFATCWTTE